MQESFRGYFVEVDGDIYMHVCKYISLDATGVQMVHERKGTNEDMPGWRAIASAVCVSAFS